MIGIGSAADAPSPRPVRGRTPRRDSLITVPEFPDVTFYVTDPEWGILSPASGDLPCDRVVINTDATDWSYVHVGTVEPTGGRYPYRPACTCREGFRGYAAEHAARIVIDAHLKDHA